MTALKRGDLVRLRPADSEGWCDASVELASDTNPSSVFVTFPGHALRTPSGGMYLNCAPLYVDYGDGHCTVVSDLRGDLFVLEVRE